MLRSLVPISQPAHREYRFPLPLGCARCYSEPPLGACPQGCSAPHQPSTGGSDRLWGPAPTLQRNQSCPHLWMWRLPHCFTHQEDRAQRGLHPHQPQVPSEPCRCPRADPHAGATAASQSETLCCLTFWSIFPLAQGAPCPGLAPRVTRCWGAQRSSPCWKHFFCVPAQRRDTFPTARASLSQPFTAARAPAVVARTATHSWLWGSAGEPSRAGNSAGQSTSRPST